MKAVFLLVLAAFVASGYTHQVETSLTGRVLKDILEKLNGLIDKGQEVLQYLTEILESSGEKIINDIVNKIQAIIDKTQEILQSAGECGISQLDNLINLGKDETSAAVTCVTSNLPKLGEVVVDLGKYLKAATELSLAASAKIVKCEALGPILAPICLAKEAVTLVPDIEKIIADISPVLEDAWALEKSLIDCEVNILDALEKNVNQIIIDVDKCLKG